MTAVTPSQTHNSKLSLAQRRVSFRPYVEIAIIPPVDPETKHLQYYSQSELVNFQLEVKRQILAMRNSIMETKKKQHSNTKRATSPTSTVDDNNNSNNNDDHDDNDTSPMKRMRITPPSVVPVGV